MGTALRKMDERESAWVGFAAAVSTGFRRTDPNTGRTVELFLCPKSGGGTPGDPDQSSGFVAEAKDGRARCVWCDESHPIIEFFEAEARGLIFTKWTGDHPDDDGPDAMEAVNFGADQIADGIRLISRPAKRTARG